MVRLDFKEIDMRKKMSFMVACRDFFGMLPSQGLQDFAKELKALTPADRADITKGLEQNGYEITAS